jgi:putative transposase
MVLIPTKKQEQSFRSHLGASRFAYNWALDYVFQNWKDVKEGKSSEYVNKTAYGLRNALNAIKRDIAPWYKENGARAFETGCFNAAAAINNWIESKSGQTKRKYGFPQYKTKRLGGSSVSFCSPGIVLSEDNHKIFLSKIGHIKIANKQKTLRWLIKEGGKITKATLSFQHARWMLAVTIRAEETLALKYFNGRKSKEKKEKIAGIDVGTKVFLTSSDGFTIENPKHYRVALVKLRKAQKRLSRRNGGNRKKNELASARYEKAKYKLQKTHADVYNKRRDFLNKTSKLLIDKYEIIGLENLNIKGLLKNRHLSMSISDAGWGEFKRQMYYKSNWYGSTIIDIPTFYPSSKTCSNCGVVKDKLSLSERTYKCKDCGLVLDRDLNAAINIKRYAELEYVASGCGETLNERGDGSAGQLLVTGETTVYETLSRPSLQALNG